eukprot:5595868-Lingulodinium_polyedra.AAC.1
MVGSVGLALPTPLRLILAALRPALVQTRAGVGSAGPVAHHAAVEAALRALSPVAALAPIP